MRGATLYAQTYYHNEEIKMYNTQIIKYEINREWRAECTAEDGRELRITFTANGKITFAELEDEVYQKFGERVKIKSIYE